MKVFFLGVLLLVSISVSSSNEVKRQSLIAFPRVGRSIYNSDSARPDSFYINPERSIQSQVLQGVRQYKRQGLIPYPRVGKRQSFIAFPRVGKRQSIDGSDPLDAYSDLSSNTDNSPMMYDAMEPSDEFLHVYPRSVGKFPFGPRLGREKREVSDVYEDSKETPKAESDKHMFRFPFSPRLGNCNN